MPRVESEIAVCVQVSVNRGNYTGLTSLPAQGRDPVTSLKAKTGSQENRLTLFLPTLDSGVSGDFTKAPLSGKC